MTYTRDDVIINKEQAEKFGLKIGDVVYYHNDPALCKDDANKDYFPEVLEEIDWNDDYPFKVDKEKWECIVKKKIPVKVEKPLNFKNKEDREKLMNSWFIERHPSGNTTNYMRAVEISPTKIWIGNADPTGINAKCLLNDFLFEDGSICGHIEEEVR